MPQDLSPCPFCGESKGYTLSDGSTFRWWVVSCAGCGGDVGECRSDSSTRLDAPKPERWPAADDEWNEAAAHAQSLRTALEAQAAEIARQQQVITDVNARCDHLGMRLGEVIKERDGLRVDAERWAAECNKRDDHISGWLAACAFIDLHVADPDLNSEMVAKYAEFQRWREHINSAAREST